MNIWKEKAVAGSYNKLFKLPLGSIKAKGWIEDQLLRNKQGMGGNLDLLEPEMIATPFINYSHFADLPFDSIQVTEDFAAGWSGEISGTYWTGLVELAYTLQDEDLIKKAETFMAGVLKHQEEDGYLGSYPAHCDRMLDYNPWSAAWLYRAMLSFYEATGREEVLDAVYRGLLWFCENWKDNKTDYVGSTIIEPMIIVYFYKNDKKLLDFCLDWLDWLEKNSKWQNKVSQYLSEKLPYASMHTVAYGEDVKHPGIVYAANGDKKLLDASINGLKKALEKIVQRSGGPGSCTEFLSPKGASNETEYCNFATFNHSYSWMELLTGEAKWADEIERCLFNGAQGARKKDERAIAYMTSPNQLRATRHSAIYAELPEYGVYAPCYNVACCPAQSVRIIPEFVRGMALVDREDNLYINCFGPAEIKTPKFEIEMDTMYPFRENVIFNVKKAEDTTIYVRIPAWCKNPSFTLNGEKVDAECGDNGFALIGKKVVSGDTLVATFPMEVEVIKVDDSDAAAKFPMSVERGPLVYAIEVPAVWSEYEGNPITKPLPEGWCWYEAIADTKGIDPAVYYMSKEAPWARAVDEDLSPEDVKAEECENDGYVWENPMVKLEVPMYHTKYGYSIYSPQNHESWAAPLDTEGEKFMCTMVPYGCTNLRISYLPRAKKQKQTI